MNMYLVAPEAKIYAYVRLYRVAPKGCSPRDSLANIVACTHEPLAAGLGLEIGVSVVSCGMSHWMPDVCPRCKAIEQSAKDRVAVADAVAKRHKLTTWRNSRHSLYRSAYLHICRSGATKGDIRLARIARKSAVEMFRKRGYTVHMTNDDGGTEELEPRSIS